MINLFQFLSSKHIFLLLILVNPVALAQSAAVWNSSNSGTIDGADFTVTGMKAASIINSNMSTADYAPPLSDNQQTVSYRSNSEWTITFDRPVRNLRLYIDGWRNGEGGNTSGTFSEMANQLSGSNFTVTGMGIDVTDNFAFGVVEITEEVSVLSFQLADADSDQSFIGMTFTGSSIAPPVPTLSEWGLLNLALLLMICGILYLVHFNVINTSSIGKSEK